MLFKIKVALRNWSDKSNFGSIVFQFARKTVAKFMLILSDEKYAQWFYKFYTKKKLNLKDPKYFDEKVWWLKLNNRVRFSNVYQKDFCVLRAGFPRSAAAEKHKHETKPNAFHIHHLFFRIISIFLFVRKSGKALKLCLFCGKSDCRKLKNGVYLK